MFEWSFNDTKKGQHLPRNGSSNKRITQEKLNGLNANGNKVKFEGKPEELSELKNVMLHLNYLKQQKHLLEKFGENEKGL
jgi:hypothetical protein